MAAPCKNAIENYITGFDDSAAKELSKGKDMGVSVLNNLKRGENDKSESERFIQDAILTIGRQVQAPILQDLQQSPWYSIMIDETTDIQVVNEMIVYGRYLKDGQSRTEFLRMIPLRNGTAATIMEALLDFLQDINLPLKKMCAIGSDGASVMVGKKNGVGAKLRELVPHILSNHCVAHRLALAVGQSTKDIAYLKTFKSVLDQLHRFYKYSSVRTAALHQIQELYDDKTLKLTQAKDVRWLSHDLATNTLRKCFPAVVSSLEREAQERDDAQALGLATFVKSYKFIGSLLMMCDVLPHMSALSKAMQTRDAVYTVIRPLVNGTISIIQQLKAQPGEHYGGMDDTITKLQDQQFDVRRPTESQMADFHTNVYTKFLNNIENNLRDRFPDLPMIEHFGQFNTAQFPDDEEDLASYANAEMKTLASHFHLDEQRTELEWRQVKAVIRAHLQQTWTTTNLFSRNVVLTDVIENLGEYLTNKETSTRARATRLIADILANLPTDFLTRTQVSLLVTYLCEKLKDHHSLQAPALCGLLPLTQVAGGVAVNVISSLLIYPQVADGVARFVQSQSPNLTGETVEAVCRIVFTEVHTQSLPQADRRSVFTILHNFLNNHLEDVQRLEGDFVYGYIQTMDAEKDPRNLILAFNCAAIIIQNFSLGVFVEEMFEVVSCYFPIDFTPSASDPSGIKKEDLVMSLRRCLAATPKFAQYCLPLLLEKLTSDLKSAKIDSFETLGMCAETYSTESLNEFQSSFFNCIKKEVFLSGDTVLEEAALTALRALVKALSSGVTQSDAKKSLDSFVEEILTECKNHLLQPELMLMLSSGRLLQAAALGSDRACSQIVKTTVPLLIETHNKQKQVTPRHNVILVLNGFLECTAKFHYDQKNPNPMLHTYKDHLIAVYTQALDDDVVSIQLLGVQGFHILVNLPAHSLLDPERTFIASKLVNKAIQSTCEQVIRLACTGTLQYMLSTYTDSIQNDVLPTIFSLLHNEPMLVDGGGTVSRPQLLEVLSAITSGASTVQRVVDVLCDMLENTDSVELYEAITACLARVAENCSGDGDSISILCNVGVKSVHKLVVSKCRCQAWRDRLTSEVVLTNLSAFIRHIAINWQQELSAEIQSMFIQSFLKATGEGNPDQFSPLQASCDTIYVCLLTPVICSGPPQTEIPHQLEILNQLTSLVCQPLEPDAHTHVCKCLSALINKHTQDAGLDAMLVTLKDQLESCLGSDKGEARAQDVAALAWITKALVLRNHKLATQYTDKLIELLSHEAVGREAARGFCIVLTEYQDVMNKAMRANIKLMYRQRFFIENLPKIVQGYQTASKETKKNHLIALSYLIHGLNKQVLIPELPKIYPLLIQSLLCDDVDLQLATMETLADLIHNAPKVIDQQIDSMVPQLLKMTTYKPSMKIRIAALKCLAQLTGLSLHVILPYRNKITRALLPVLDDKKRLVRAEAVVTRHEWFMLETDKK